MTVLRFELWFPNFKTDSLTTDHWSCFGAFFHCRHFKATVISWHKLRLATGKNYIILAQKSIYLSSPLNPLSIASGSSDLRRSCVMDGDPRHRVDRRLITVEILGLDLLSGVMLTLPGVLDTDTLGPTSPTFSNRFNSSSTSPLWDKGAGSIPLRVNRSARDAKQRNAPSATWHQRGMEI